MQKYEVYWPEGGAASQSENVIDWLGKWRPTCVMRHARGQKLQSFRRKWLYGSLFWLALVSIYQTDVTSFSEDGRGVKWLCN
jgi:hypothetical protein